LKILSIFCFLFGIIPAFAQVSPDSLALVELYNKSNGSSWTLKNNWLTNNPINTWYGIKTEKYFTGTFYFDKVIEINLPSNKLSGEIDTLFFPNLQKINLSNNNLNCKIVKWNLPSLNHLEINRCVSDGQFELPISDSITFISATDNKYSSLPDSLKSNSLIELHLGKNKIEGNLPTLVIPNLKSLNLNNNLLSGDIKKTDYLDKLETLNLSNNKFENIDSITNPNIISLNLSFNQLNGNLPIVVSDKIQSIDYSDNNFSGEIDFSSKNDLTYLNLAYNNFHQNKLDKLGSVKTLRLEGNKITDELEIVNADSLSILNISGNKIYSLIGINNLPNLKEINLSNCKFTWDKLEAIRPEVQLMAFTQDTILPLNYAIIDDAIQLSVFAEGDSINYTWRDENSNIISTSSTLNIENIGSFRCETANNRVPLLKINSVIQNILPISNLEDSLLLVSIYENTNGKNWLFKENWLSDKTINNWQNVSTSVKKSGLFFESKVQELDLSWNLLNGTLPAFTFTNIEKFIANNNNISSEFINQSSSNLKYIDLSFNKLEKIIFNSTVENGDSLLIMNNKLTSKYYFINISNNKLAFGELEKLYENSNFNFIDYSNQDTIISFEAILNSSLQLECKIEGSNNIYRWFRNDTLLDFTTKSITTDFYGTYRCEISNAIVKNLILQTEEYNYINSDVDLHKLGLNIYNSGYDMLIQNNSNLNYTIKIYNLLGSELANYKCDANSSHSIELGERISILKFTSNNSSFIYKYIK